MYLNSFHHASHFSMLPQDAPLETSLLPSSHSLKSNPLNPAVTTLLYPTTIHCLLYFLKMRRVRSFERRSPIYLRPEVTLTRRRRRRRIRMDPDCAICSQPALARCECESKGLDTAVRQAEQRMMASVFTEIRYASSPSLASRLIVPLWLKAYGQVTDFLSQTELGSVGTPKTTSCPSSRPSQPGAKNSTPPTSTA